MGVFPYNLRESMIQLAIRNRWLECECVIGELRISALYSAASILDWGRSSVAEQEPFKLLAGGSNPSALTKKVTQVHPDRDAPEANLKP